MATEIQLEQERAVSVREKHVHVYNRTEITNKQTKEKKKRKKTHRKEKENN